MKNVIYGAGSTLSQNLISKLLPKGEIVCGVLHSDVTEDLIDVPYVTKCDAKDYESVQQSFSSVVDIIGTPDNVVCCVGKSEHFDFLEDDINKWYDVFETNFYSAVNICHVAAHRMKKREHGGSIVIVGSGYGVRHIPELSSYCVSKGALLPLVKTLSTELAAYKIRINLVTPGLFPSKMTHQFVSNKKYISQLIKHIPDGQIGTPDDVSSVISFLLSDMSKHINGTEFIVDGGMLNLIEGGILR